MNFSNSWSSFLCQLCIIFFYSHTTNSSYTALFLTAPRVRIISRCAFKFGRDKDNGIQFPRLIKFVAPALLDVGRSKFPMCRDGSYQGNPSSGASVAHQPSASRYRMTAQLARKREKERECRVATPFRGAPPTASWVYRPGIPPCCVPLLISRSVERFSRVPTPRKIRRRRRRRPPVSVRRAVID